jgi:CheY-like chemotaxis protein
MFKKIQLIYTYINSQKDEADYLAKSMGDQLLVGNLRLIFSSDKYSVNAFYAITDVIEFLSSNTRDVCIVKATNSSLDTIQTLSPLFEKIPTLVAVSQKEEQLGVRCVLAGAADYIVYDRDTTSSISRTISSVIQQKVLLSEIERTKSSSYELVSMKQKFLNRIGKEFGNPLSGILGIVDLLMDDPACLHVKEYLSLIQSSAQSMSALLGDIEALTVDKDALLSSLKDPFEIKDQFLRIMSLLMVDAQDRDIELIADFHQAPEQRVIGNLLLFKQIFILLVSTLIKVLPRTSVIRIASQCSSMDISTRALFSHFAISFSHGNAPSTHLPSLIYQSDKPLGASLRLAEAFAEHLNGRIWTDFDHTGGGVIQVALPFLIEIESNAIPNNTTVVPQVAVQTEVNRKLMVLVVDDNQVNRVLFEKMLQKYGHTAHLAEDGLVALEKVSCCHYDLILMDIQMPQMDGFEVTRIIRTEEQQSGLHTNIYATSAHLNRSDLPECIARGFDGLLLKPLHLMELKLLLDTLCQSEPTPRGGGTSGKLRL